MKHLLTIALIATGHFSFGQSNMFWNNYANFNPAMSGFQYQQHASATFTNSYPALPGYYTSLRTDVGVNLADHHGVGIAYTGNYTRESNSHKALLNYNYQFQFKKAGKLSIGTGLGVGHMSIDHDYVTFGAETILPQPVTNFELNAGMAYNWKNLYLGFSATNLTPPYQDPVSSFYYGPRTAYHFHAQYAFQVAEKFQLTPRVLYTYDGGFQRLQPNLTLSYMEKFSLGVSSGGRDNFGFNAGWDIQNKFRLAYSFNQTFSKLNNGVSGGIHEFSIGYLLKN